MRGNYCGFVFSYRRTLHFYCVQNFISPEMNSENHIEALLLQLSDCIYDGFGERDRAGQGKDDSKFRRALLSEGNFWSHSF